MNTFAKILENSAEYRNLCNDIRYSRLPAGVLGLTHTPKAHLLSALCQKFGKTCLVIVPDEATGYRMAGDMRSFGITAEVYPYREMTFRFTDGRSREFEHTRLGILKRILENRIDAVLCTSAAAAQFTIPGEELRRRSLRIEYDAQAPLDKITECLSGAGYVRAEVVEGPGQFAIRGGIIDFYPPDCDNPIRVELWGDTVDSMAFFDVLSQRKTDEHIDSVEITPSTEIIFTDNLTLEEKLRDLRDEIHGKGAVKIREQLDADIEKLQSGLKPTSLDKYLNLCYDRAENLFDYMPDCFTFVVETAAVKDSSTANEKIYIEELKSLYDEGILCGALGEFCISYGKVQSLFESRGAIYVDNFARGSFDTPVKDLVTFNAHQLSPWDGSITQLMEDIYAPFARETAIVVFAGSEKTAPLLAQDLENAEVPCSYYDVLPVEFRRDRISIIKGSISAGIEYPLEKVMFFSVPSGKSSSKFVLSEGSGKNKRKKGAFTSVDELHKGDYVVHENYGIGIFDGLEEIKTAGVIKDYIKIKYAGTDVLYVPVNMLDLVSKYIGADTEGGKEIKLKPIDAKRWEKTKQRVREHSREMAGQLIKLYSERMQQTGFAFSRDCEMQLDFEERFEFVETEDQLRCINEIKSDMEMQHPMDRLLCGDVGFGKTEVALRAAFKCVADGKQCAILVPTTILAFQHYQTVMKRFEGFPISADMISRFRTAAEIKEIAEKAKKGQVDILVGTHALLSKNLKFKDLGLLIIDEEQRFGVGQKEKIKESFPGVDVLTLSATPIPRTLNMAMIGVRDMSVIEQSPRDRLPIQSYVIQYDRGVVLEAIRKELRRGGQVYYLHNTVETIDSVAAGLQEDLPDANIGVAHGKMAEQEISEVWRRLMNGDIDVLVCTTIIETGVDVPNCNTLIIENADRLGLAQLHQIRGRVGRSSRRATALFTYPEGKIISEIATRRLDAIREYTEFGSGFKIAMRDLEIRGAGSLLGGYQHGHMEAVGYDLFMKILGEAIEDERRRQNGEPTREESSASEDCLIDIKTDAYIPEDFITSIAQRLSMYRRIADIRTNEDADDVMDELLDRFGSEIPKPVLGLIDVSLLRSKAARLGFYEVRGSDKLLLYFKEFRPEFITELYNRMKDAVVKPEGGTKPCITIQSKDKSLSQLELLEDAIGILEEMEA